MSGRIPDQFLDELLVRVDIVDVVGERLTLKKSGSNHHALCPFHSEKTPSFTVSATKQFYHCFGCGAHGSAIRFLMEYERMEFREAVAQLADGVGLTIPEAVRDDSPAESLAPVYAVLAKSLDHYRGWLRRGGERAVEYLKGRGLSGEIAARYGIGFAPPGWDNLLRAINDRPALSQAGMLVEREHGRVYDRFRERIMFPIRDRRGHTLGFGGRVLGDGEPKYLNSPETPVFQKGRELYGLFEILEVDRHPSDILVVEGYMDVVALAQAGLPRAVATLGTATSVRQIERLFRVTRDLVFCFDGDEAGRRAAWRALESALPAMREGRQVRFLFLAEGDDPDSMVRRDGRTAFEQAMREALPLSDYLLRRLGDAVDLSSMDGRARLVDEAIPLLRRLPPDVYRRMLIERVAGVARLDTAYIENVVDGAGDAADRAATPAKTPPRVEEAHTVRRTPVRLAIALLLDRPTLASTVDDLETLAALDLPGMNVLLALLELGREQPHLPTSVMLERFSGSEHETALWRLATWEHMVPDGGIESEFLDTIRRLRALSKERRLQYLYERLQSGELTREEWREWQELKT